MVFSIIFGEQSIKTAMGIVNNLFRLGRHHLKAGNYLILRDRAFNEWVRVSCVQNMA
jgi:putative transposase